MLLLCDRLRSGYNTIIAVFIYDLFRRNKNRLFYTFPFFFTTYLSFGYHIIYTFE